MLPQFGTDGLRGKADEEITQRLACALGNAVANIYSSGTQPITVAVGRDTRVSGSPLQDAVASGIKSAGAESRVLGVTTTPAVAWSSSNLNCPGIMISASHNPYYDNGLKVFAPGGVKLTDEVQNQLQVLIEDCYGKLSDDAAYDSTADFEDVELVRGWEGSLAKSLDQNISFQGTKVVVDTAHGSAFESAPRVLKALGVDLTVIGNEPNGININEGFGSTAPNALQEKVVETSADIGFAFDGDADRLIAVDEKGNIVDGDKVLALLGVEFKAQGKLANDTLVVTVMSNLGLHNAMAEQGIRVLTTDVGDRNILIAMDENGHSLGGEQSGHIICRDISTTGDGLLSALQLMAAIKTQGKPFSVVADEVMTTMPQVLVNVKLAKRVAQLPEALLSKVQQADQSLGNNGRVLVRPSGTEPLIRVMVEHLEEAEAQNMANQLAEQVKLICV